MPADAKAAFLAGQFDLQHRHFMAHHAQGDYWLVLARRTPVGRLYLDRSGKIWRLLDIALVPAARGRRVGSQLIRSVQRAAASAGADLDLHVARDNRRAASLYGRLGFVGTLDAHPSHMRMLWRRPEPGLS